VAEREHTRLFVLGAGGYGKVVADTAVSAGWRSVRLLDDAIAAGSSVGPWTIDGPFEHALRLDATDAAVVAIGDNALRLAWIDRIERAGVGVATIIAPSAVVSAHARVGVGTVVVAGAIVAVDAAIGRACIINTGCSIDHDCVIGDGVHISPGARLGGGVHIGARAWVGIGASIRHGIRIGADATIGAGAAVVQDVELGTVVGGVPARPLRSSTVLR